MAGYIGDDGKYVKGIEDYLPTSLYQTDEHENTVVKEITDNLVTLSHNSKFHEIFATSGTPKAICYYRMIKKKCSN